MNTERDVETVQFLKDSVELYRKAKRDENEVNLYVYNKWLKTSDFLNLEHNIKVFFASNKDELVLETNEGNHKRTIMYLKTLTRMINENLDEEQKSENCSEIFYFQDYGVDGYVKIVKNYL